MCPVPVAVIAMWSAWRTEVVYTPCTLVRAIIRRCRDRSHPGPIPTRVFLATRPADTSIVTVAANSAVSAAMIVMAIRYLRSHSHDDAAHVVPQTEQPSPSRDQVYRRAATLFKNDTRSLKKTLRG